MTQEAVTEHQIAWWGKQACKECNPLALPPRTLKGSLRPLCPNPQCRGTGWTVWASLAKEPWTQIIPGLSVGGHDYRTQKGEIVRVSPKRLFDVVLSAYHRDGFEPDEGTEHIEILFPDSHLTPETKQQAIQAAQIVVERLLGGKTVLVRCQAGLNRSSLITGLAMVGLGYAGADAVQLIRSRRSPWALCNQEYADFISGLSAGGLTLPNNSES